MVENLFIKTFKGSIKAFFKIFGVMIIKKESLTFLIAQEFPKAALDFVLDLQTPNSKDLLPYLTNSKSQNFQDLFVLSQLGIKRNGYFVEFGASNGIDLSNTFLLEYQFEWSGILAEPAKYWSEALRKNRPNAIVEELCVRKVSDLHLPFNETTIEEHSTLDVFSESDLHGNERQGGKNMT
jgi:hypothetical protein